MDHCEPLHVCWELNRGPVPWEKQPQLLNDLAKEGSSKALAVEVGVDVKLPPLSLNLSCTALALSAPSAAFAGSSATSILWDLKPFSHFYCVCESTHIHVMVHAWWSTLGVGSCLPCCLRKEQLRMLDV